MRMKKVKERAIQPNIRNLLSFATSIKNVDREYTLYMQSPVRRLYACGNEEDMIGCIGIEFLDATYCEIKHMAVAINYRGKGIGSKMISFIKEKYSLTLISAETDKDAVNFYMKNGFKIMSLGEKYPGVERFRCILTCK